MYYTVDNYDQVSQIVIFIFQLTYGQRYAKSTGLTDGEGIERLWSYLRGFRRITKEMSIGNRQDLLTEALLHHTEKQIWNLGKIIWLQVHDFSY